MLNKKQQKDKYQSNRKKQTFKDLSKQRGSNKLSSSALKTIEDNLEVFIENK